MNSTILLFENEYNLPLIQPFLAAYMAMIFEIIFGFLLILGFFTRLATIPLICMTLVIQLFVFQNTEHYYWLFLFFTLVCFGGGRASFGFILSTFFPKIPFFIFKSF